MGAVLKLFITMMKLKCHRLASPTTEGRIGFFAVSPSPSLSLSTSSWWDSAKSANLGELGAGLTGASMLRMENLGGAKESPSGAAPFLGACVPNGDPKSGRDLDLLGLRPKVSQQG